MKRITFLIAFFLFGTSIATAQKFHFGLKASPGLSWFKSNTKGISTSGSKLGFSYGIVTEFAFNDAENYSFATGLDFTNRGGNINYDSAGASIENDIKLQYLDIPLTLKMKTTAFDKIKYFGQVGFVPGFNIKSRAETTSSTGNTEEDDFSNKTNVFGLSFLIALGLEYSFGGTTSGFASLSFNNGLLDVTDESIPVPDGSSLKATNSLVALNLGVLF